MPPQSPPPKRPFYRTKWGIAGIVVGVLILIGAISGAAGGKDDSTTTTVAEVTTTTKKATTTTTKKVTTTTKPATTTTTVSPQAFKDSCKTVEYRVFKKDAGKMVGEPLTFKGEVIQAMESDGTTIMRVAVEKTSYGWDYNSVVLVVFPGELAVYEDDVVQLWGLCNGDHTYESQAGYNITVPSVLALYVETL